MSTKSSYLIFWMLVHIWAKPGLVQQIRDEIALFAQTTQPPQLFSIPELPRLKLDMDGLVRSCPLLRASFHETIRLHSMPTSIRSVQRAITFHEAQGPNRTSGSSRSFALEAGSTIAAPLALHHHDPRYFESPTTDFQPSRFLESSENAAEGKHHGNEGEMLRAWGVGSSTCPGRTFGEQQVLAFVAGILALWDFEPAGSEWVIPKQTERAVLSVPAADIRVRLKPRQIS